MLSRIALLSLRRSAPRLVRDGHHHAPSAADIEKVPPQFRNITYDDVPFPKGRHFDLFIIIPIIIRLILNKLN